MQKAEHMSRMCISLYHIINNSISFLGYIHIYIYYRDFFCFVCLLLPHTLLKHYDKDDGGCSLVVLVFFEQRAQNKAKEYWKEKSQALCQNEGGKSG